MNSNHHNRQLGLVLGFVGVIIFGATLPATRIAVGVFDPWFVTFGRALLAAIAAIVCLAILRRPVPWHRAPSLALAGLFVTVGFPGFMGLAMQTVPAIHGGVVLGILPLATAGFAALIGGERPSPLFWFWGFAGTFLVSLFALRDGEFGFAIGDLWLLFSALCASCGYVVLAKLTNHMPGWEAISWALVISLPVSLTGSLITWDSQYLMASNREIIAFLYLGLFSMYIGFFAWNTGMKLGGIARVGQLQLLQTFITLAIAALLLGEKITMETMIFAVAVLVIIVLGQRARVEKGIPYK